MSKNKSQVRENTVRADADCPWESGALGASEEHAVQSPAQVDDAIDDAMELQLISIRLPKALIEDLKFLAKREGVGYQPLIRRVMVRYAQGEFKSIAYNEMKIARAQNRLDEQVDPPLRRKRA